MYLTFLGAPGSYKSHFFIDVYLVRKADKGNILWHPKTCQ